MGRRPCTDCTQAARSDTEFCNAHDGGRRCQHECCLKSAVDGGTPHSKAHGGGKRCQKEHCFHLVYGAENVYCGPCLQAMRTDDTQQAAPQQRRGCAASHDRIRRAHTRVPGARSVHSGAGSSAVLAAWLAPS